MQPRAEFQEALFSVGTTPEEFEVADRLYDLQYPGRQRDEHYEAQMLEWIGGWRRQRLKLA